MGNFDEEDQPYEHRILIYDDGITHKSCADEGHAMPDQDDDPTPDQTEYFMNMHILLPRG